MEPPTEPHDAPGFPGPPSGADLKPKDNQVRIGVAFAFGLIPVFFVGVQFANAVAQWSGYTIAYGPTLFLLPLLYLLGVHVYATARKQLRILAGFWATTLILVAILVVSCFALIALFLTNY